MTNTDIDISNDIWGPKSVSKLKGTSTRPRPARVRLDEVDIPRELIAQHHKIELHVDLMFVSGVIFLTAIDEPIRYRSVVPIDSRSSRELLRAIKSIMAHYNIAGFLVKMIYCDPEFTPLKDVVERELLSRLNPTAADDHDPFAERNNRTIGERVRTTYHELPYKTPPKIMIRYMTMNCANQLNMFPAKGGISQYYSPYVILKKRHVDYNIHCQVPFGAYVEGNDKSKPYNDNKERTVSGIYLRPMSNLQGSHEIMDLHSGKRITRCKS